MVLIAGLTVLQAEPRLGDLKLVNLPGTSKTQP